MGQYIWIRSAKLKNIDILYNHLMCSFSYITIRKLEKMYKKLINLINKNM